MTTRPSGASSGVHGKADIPAIGPLVHLSPLSPSKLPAHPDLATSQGGDTTLPDLQSFVSAVLSEGESFITKYLPAVISVRTAKRTVPPSRATVQLSEHHMAAADLPAGAKTSAGEAWFIRSSMHEDEAKAGTGDWAEFEGALLDDHSQHEMDYTPDVFDAHKVLGWDDELEALGRSVGPWDKVSMSIHEMAHKLPPPLTNRVFAVLVVSARKQHSRVQTHPAAAPRDSFIIVQIPVLVADVPSALYANNRHRQAADSPTKRKPVALGVYASVERCEREGSGHVKWVMAVASDAKGYLPQWVQRMAIPDAIAKDVALVVEWLDKRRKGKGGVAA